MDMVESYCSLSFNPMEVKHQLKKLVILELNHNHYTDLIIPSLHVTLYARHQ